MKTDHLMKQSNWGIFYVLYYVSQSMLHGMSVPKNDPYEKALKWKKLENSYIVHSEPGKERNTGWTYF
jgi:hypothetical protein